MVRLTDLVKTNNVIKISPQDTLTMALAKLSTSHDSGFVFSKEGKYLGVINPYYTVIKASYPANAKVEHCLFHAPHVYLNTQLNKLAQLFIDSKVHYLPVFNQEEKFIGIVSARRLLASFRGLSLFNVSVKVFLKTKKNFTYTINENDLISKALNLLKEKRISKLIVVNKDNRLRGILSYYDLIAFLVSPRHSSHRGDREGNKVSFYRYPVRHFSKSYVLTLSENHSLQDVLRLIIEKKIGSVVIVDDKRHPIGIITTKDILRYFIGQKIYKKMEIVTKNLSTENRQILGGFFKRFNFFLKKKPTLKKAKLFVKEEKKGGLFEAVLALFPKKGSPEVIKREGKNLLSVLEPIGKVLKKNKKE